MSAGPSSSRTIHNTTFGPNANVHLGDTNTTHHHHGQLLPTAKDAAFDSYLEGQNAHCHPETRVELLNTINEWIEKPDSKPIFWLSGMAGTGKSTVSRTIAKSLQDRGILGASFFFKRGEESRSNAKLFFPTIAHQLTIHHPQLKRHIQAALRTDPDLAFKTLGVQFDKLVFQPLKQLEGYSRLAFVIDALDECGEEEECEKDTKAIIHLFKLAKEIQSLDLKVILTSRPEWRIRLGFSDIRGSYDDCILHEIPEPIIAKDIGIVLQNRFAQIRDKHNGIARDEGLDQLPMDWPTADSLERLVQLSVPLFIYAITICNLVSQANLGDPAAELAQILSQDEATSKPEAHLESAYCGILERMISQWPPRERNGALEVFYEAVGAIMVLSEPVPSKALAALLGKTRGKIHSILRHLRSVLLVPQDERSAIRVFHSSFRDFLLKPGENHRFIIDERACHFHLATQCIRVMNKELRKNICGVTEPGVCRHEIDVTPIREHLRYASRYWVHHLVQGGHSLVGGGQVLTFLRSHFLHWIEVLSLLGSVERVLAMLMDLQSAFRVCTDRSSPRMIIRKDLQLKFDYQDFNKLDEFLADGYRFVLNCNTTIARFPLQLYSSAIVFTPVKSIIRTNFLGEASPWIASWPTMRED